MTPKRTLAPLCAIAALSLASCSGTETASDVHDEGQTAHWGYEADNGPDDWSSMNPEWILCAEGLEQSPIDLANATESSCLMWRSTAAAEEDARRALAELRAATPPPRRAPERGDRFMLQHDYALRSPLEVQQAFGARFAQTLFELEPGWHGPVVSGYGIHVVYVGERVEHRIPEYEEVRDRLVVDYNRMRRDRANELLYEGLVGGYEVEIDEEALQRAALRTTNGIG